jgi:aryl-alcohol dehydrogenase-like predicted oxidoreductase
VTNKLSIGTAKFCNHKYGFSSNPKLDIHKKNNFFEDLIKTGIYRFDTSPRYGESEELIGTNLDLNNFFVSSKIDNLLLNDNKSPNKMVKSVKSSLKKLKKKFLDVCYLHQNEIQILSDPYIQEGLEALKDLKLIKKSGASVYSLDEFEYCINNNFFDYIQIPISIADTSFYKKIMTKTKSDKTFVGRSILLQGSLVNTKIINNRIQYSNEIIDYLNKLDSIRKTVNLTRLEFYLAFVSSLSAIDHFIIGSTSINNIKKNIKSMELNLDKLIMNSIFEHSNNAKVWANPRNWV